MFFDTYTGKKITKIKNIVIKQGKKYKMKSEKKN